MNHDMDRQKIWQETSAWSYRKELPDTDLFNQSVPLNLLLVKNFDSNRLPIFSVLCKPDLCEGSLPNGASELILPNTALHLWWQCSSLSPIHLRAVIQTPAMFSKPILELVPSKISYSNTQVTSSGEKKVAKTRTEEGNEKLCGRTSKFSPEFCLDWILWQNLEKSETTEHALVLYHLPRRKN